MACTPQNSNIYFYAAMDLNLSLRDHEDEINVQPGELLEDCWFFGNPKSKSRMLRSFSDPCSSSNFAGSSYEETYESINKLSSRDPTAATTKERRSNRKASSRNSLARAPSLPTSLETEDFDDDEEEMEFSMGKLIRQASLNYSHARPPRTNVPKSSSLRRRKPEVNKLTTQKSLKDVGIEELQGFKDLGFGEMEERERSPNVGKIEKRRNAEESEEKRGASAEAPPVPRWGGKRSTEDMKAQIKFWARAVASNVRQEC